MSDSRNHPVWYSQPIITRLFIAFFIVLSIFCSSCEAFGNPFEYENFEVNRGAYWNGRIWFFKSNQSCASCRAAVELMSIAPDSDEKPRFEEKTITPTDDLFLLADKDRLWLIGNEYLGYFKDKDITPIQLEEPFQEIFRPFLFKGAPAVFEKRGDDIALLVLKSGKWREREVFQLKNGSKVRIDWLKVVPIGKHLHAFWRYKADKDVYYHDFLEDEPFQSAKGSIREIIPDIGRYTFASQINNAPCIFFLTKGRYINQVTGVTKKDGKWQKFFAGPKRSAREGSMWGIYPAHRNGEFVLMQRVFGGQISYYTYKDSKRISKHKFGQFKLSSFMAFMPLLVFITMFAVIFDMILYKYRPLWMRKAGITIFKSVKIYPKSKVNIDELLSCETLKKAPCIDTIHRSKKMLFINTLSDQFMSIGTVFPLNAIITVVETSDGLIIRYFSRLSITFSLIFVILLVATSGILSRISQGGMRPIGFVVGVVLFVWISQILLYFTMRKRSKAVLFYVLSQLGFEEKIQEEIEL